MPDGFCKAPENDLKSVRQRVVAPLFPHRQSNHKRAHERSPLVDQEFLSVGGSDGGLTMAGERANGNLRPHPSQLKTRGTCPSSSSSCQHLGSVSMCPSVPLSLALLALLFQDCHHQRPLAWQHSRRPATTSGWNVIFASCCAMNAAGKRATSQPRGERCLQPGPAQPNSSRDLPSAILADWTGCLLPPTVSASLRS